jgi:uncharacterized protein YigE (DUF2233 family)
VSRSSPPRGGARGRQSAFDSPRKRSQGAAIARSRSSHRSLPTGCLKSLLLLLLAGLVSAWIFAQWAFNVNSNLVAWSVRDSREGLLVRVRGKAWKSPSQVTPAELSAALVERHREPGFSWRSLRVRRPAGALGHLTQGLLGAEIHVITLSPDQFELMTSHQPSFAVTTAAERLGSEKLWFAVTANFRDPEGRPLGWVWHEGRQVNRAFPEWSGCFFVKGGRPYFGPKSLLEEVPGPIEEGVQVYPSVMKNHTIFPYVSLKPDAFFDGSKITYRSLGGMRRDGTIVFVLSGSGGVMNVMEAAELALKLDVQHATLLDGGRALQYSLRTEDGPWHFTAFNTRLDFGSKLLERQRSPVFIGARRRAPEIIAVPPAP